MTDRFHDSGATLHDFADEALIVCPRCERQAIVRAVPAELGWQARMVCRHCGFNKDEAMRGCTLGEDRDPYFSNPLWLQERCCGEVLWAYNERHLRYLEAFVRAKIRQRAVSRTPTGARNQTLVSRLPGWIKRASHRAEILSCIERLKARL